MYVYLYVCRFEKEDKITQACILSNYIYILYIYTTLQCREQFIFEKGRGQQL